MLSTLALLATVPFPQETAASTAAAVDAVFAQWNRDDSPGVAVCVVKDGKAVLTRCYGMADLENGVPITPTTVFDIASVSKQFGAFAVASLVERGELELDADVRAYLPNAIPHVEPKVTIDHLVHHTSGVRDWPATLAAAGWRMDDVISFEQILWMANHQRDLNFAPGDRYMYSNTGYNLLAATVAAVGKTSFREWMHDHVFEPLEMSSTHFHDDHTEVVSNVARSYRRDGSRWTYVTDNLTALASSSLFTTIEDLVKWVVNFETAEVGGREVIERMRTRGVLNNGSTIPYAFGQSRTQFGQMEAWSHTGSWAGFRTQLTRCPSARLAVILLANNDRVSTDRLVGQVARLFVDLGAQPRQPRRPPGAGPAPEPARDDLSVYLGRYWSDELQTLYEVARDGDTLVMLHRKNGTIELQPVDLDRFRTRAWYVSTVEFERDGAASNTMFINSSRVRRLRFRRVEGR